MLYQEAFQSGENPSEINVSSCIYVNGFNGDRNTEKYGFPNHCHSFYELVYIYEGEGEAFVNGRHFRTTAHSLYFVPPLVVHGSQGCGRGINLILQFSHTFLNRNASSFPKDAMLIPDGTMMKEGVITVGEDHILDRYLTEIAQIAPNFITPVDLEECRINYTVKYEWKLNGLALRIIDRLLEMDCVKVENNVGDFVEVRKIQAVLNRLITHPEEKLCMKKAAQMACLSYSNFSRTFSRIVGRSYVDYCNETKVHRAEEILKASDTSVTQLSQILGFGSVSYFNRIFRHYTGSTPMQYRDQFR